MKPILLSILYLIIVIIFYINVNPIRCFNSVKSTNINIYDNNNNNNKTQASSKIINFSQILSNLNSNSNSNSSDCFRAAVFEHYRIDKYVADNNWYETVKANLNVYKKVAKLASENGAKIIVFPEDGILIGSRDFIDPGLPELPDPNLLTSNNNNPCNQPDYFKGNEFEVLRNLSCMAKENNIYIVANFGSKLTCKQDSNITINKNKQTIERKCPKVGYFAFNTNVVLKSDGTFLKRYRKYNLFIEVFDKATELEPIYFDSPFGRFGTFICFDIVFKSPAIDLIEKFNINTVLYPTLWYDELPILSSILIQNALSLSENVNLLASNIHSPSNGTVGSGIYSKNNILYTNIETIGPKLLISTIPKDPKKNNSNCNFNPLIINIEIENFVYRKAEQHHQYELLESDQVYVVNKNNDKKTICNKQVCCSIEYKIKSSNNNNNDNKEQNIYNNRTILIVRDNVRPGLFKCYEQVCLLATLTESYDKGKVQKFSKEGLIKFDKLLIESTFNSDTYIYPLTSYSLSSLINRTDVKFNCNNSNNNLKLCKLNYLNKSTDNYINTFGLYGRLFNGDQLPK